MPFHPNNRTLCRRDYSVANFYGVMGGNGHHLGHNREKFVAMTKSIKNVDIPNSNLRICGFVVHLLSTHGNVCV